MGHRPQGGAGGLSAAEAVNRLDLVGVKLLRPGRCSYSDTREKKSLDNGDLETLVPKRRLNRMIRTRTCRAWLLMSNIAQRHHASLRIALHAAN